MFQMKEQQELITMLEAQANTHAVLLQHQTNILAQLQELRETMGSEFQTLHDVLEQHPDPVSAHPIN